MVEGWLMSGRVEEEVQMSYDDFRSCHDVSCGHVEIAD